MQKEDQVTICFVGTSEQKTLLEQWAKEDERSVSYVMRQILRREAQHRQAQATNQKPVTQPS